MMFSQIKRSVIAAGVMLFGLYAGFAAECRWLANGTGGWADETRWQDGVKPTQAGDTVVVAGNNVVVPVGDADLSTFQYVSEMTISSASSCVSFNTSSDVHTAAAFKGAGYMVKLGTTTLYLDNLGGPGTSAADCKASIGALGGLIISNGVVRLPDRTAGQLHVCKTTIEKDGELRLSMTTSISISGGICGTGTISGDNPKTSVYLTGGKQANPPNFAGKITFNGHFGIYDWVDFTGTESTANTFCSLFGSLGITKFGTYSATTPGASSTGNNESYNFGYLGNIAQPELRYLGTAEETCNKELRFTTQLDVGTVDAGNYGGVTFTGAWRISSWSEWGTANNMFRRVVLAGENTEHPCIIQCAMNDSDVSSTYFTKKGTGIWRFADNANRQNAGTLAVQRGTVQFTSIAEKGTICSLGTSALTCEDVSKTREANRVPYAFLLGDGTHTAADDYVATMEYVGDAAASCTTRVFAVNGAARLRSMGGAMKLAGVTAYGSGTSELVLDGAEGRTDTLSSVTNGPGKLNVIKRGAGTWNLGGKVDVGGISVENGVLKLGCEAFTYYRFSVCQTYGSSTYVYCRGIALYDAGGNVANGTLGQTAINWDKAGRPELLDPGEVTVGRNYSYTHSSGRNPANWLKYDAKTGVVGVADSFAEDSRPAIDNRGSWYVLCFRLPEGTPPIAAYDIKSQYAASTSFPGSTEIDAWQLEGSTDGMNWVVLDKCNKNPHPATTYGQWFSTGTTTSDGFDAASRESATELAMDTLQVAQGGLIAFVDPVVGQALDELTLDAENSGGTIIGATFAENGTLNLVNCKKGVEIPINLSGCTDYKYIEKWTVKAGDKTLSNKVRVTATGITLLKKGILAIVY